MKFAELDLHPSLQENLDKLKFTIPTPIQVESFEPIVSGKDIGGLAQTGTGKTAAFLIPLIQRILDQNPKEGSLCKPFSNWQNHQFILVLVPTRELAEQVHENVKSLTENTGLTSTVVYGGTSYDNQKEALNEGVDFIVSTPGRLIDLYKAHFVDLKQARGVVFDEADRMFDMGFKDDMRYIIERLPKDRQYLMYSATLDFEVLNTAYEFGANPIEINISKDETKAENVNHEILHVGQQEKPQFLISLIKKYDPKQLIIFTNFKSNVDRISQFLNQNNIPSHGISSLLNQKQRNRIMTSFKEAKVKVLVATDVAARGLDVKGIDLVINFDLPDDAATYVHRIGRTGRADSKGVAYSLVSDLDVAALSRIEKLLGEKIGIGWLENDEILSDFSPFPRYSPSQKLQNVERKKQHAKKENRTGHRPKGERRRKPRSSEDENSSSAKQRPHHKKKAKSFREVAESSQPNVHRDRTSGRHKPKAKKQNKKVRTRSSKVRTRTGSGAELSHRASKNTSVGSKIKGFIKSIFS